MWCKLWVLLTFLASWASPFSFLLSKMLVRKWMRKVSPLASLDLGARLPWIMTYSMFLFAAEFIKTDGQESFSHPALPVNNSIVNLPCPRDQCWKAHWCHLASRINFISMSGVLSCLLFFLFFGWLTTW